MFFRVFGSSFGFKVSPRLRLSRMVHIALAMWCAMTHSCSNTDSQLHRYPTFDTRRYFSFVFKRHFECELEFKVSPSLKLLPRRVQKTGYLAYSVCSVIQRFFRLLTSNFNTRGHFDSLLTPIPWAHLSPKSRPKVRIPYSRLTERRSPPLLAVGDS